MSRLNDKDREQIREMFRQTGSVRQTSKRTGHCRKVIRRVLVVAPHADDESFGCGGCLLRHAAQGDPSHWLLLTGMRTWHGR